MQKHQVKFKKLKILMLAEYFAPFDFGGSEWSVYYLAKGLAKKGYSTTIITPNYGSVKANEQIDGFTVLRFPFYKKIKDKNPLSPFWQTNIIWTITTIINVLTYCLRRDVDVIHIQGKYFLPAAIIAKFFLKKKVIITLRDYTVLCPLGMCILRNNKACNFWQYLTSDLNLYFKLYMKDRNLFSRIIQLFASLRAKIISQILKGFLNLVDEKVAVSKLVKKIYESAGVEDIKVIYNAIETISKVKMQRKNEGVFAGRLTPGKGPQLIIEALQKVLQKQPNFKFVFFGQGLLKKDLIRQVNSLKLNKKIIFAGHVDHNNVIKRLSRAKLSVIPSIWPEPLSRVGLESLASSTPLVVSTNSGNKEFFKNGKWGYVKDPNPDEIALGILASLKRNDILIDNLEKDKKEIETKFSTDVYKKYSDLYSKLSR